MKMRLVITEICTVHHPQASHAIKHCQDQRDVPVAPPPARCRHIHGHKDYLAIVMSKECPLW